MAAAVVFLASAAAATAQTVSPRPGVGPADRPRVDAAAADRGRRVWATECITCHGAAARGTEHGANLIRSLIVLRDRYGSELGPFLRKGHPMQSGAASASLTAEQITDLTHFLRQRIEDTLRGSVVFVPGDILTGNAAAGRRYFEGDGRCTSCHSATGDLAGLAARIPNLVDVQQRMLFPTGRGRGAGLPAGVPAGAQAGPNRAAVTVTITPRSGAPVSGVLVAMDSFYVTIRDATNAIRVIRRSPDLTIVKTDPLEEHRRLLRTITDRNIHDLVAYLVTLK